MDVTGILYSSPLLLLEPLQRAPHAFWSRAQIRALLFTTIDGSTQLRELDPQVRMHLTALAKDAADDAVLAAWMRPLREQDSSPARDPELAHHLFELANTALTHADLELSAQSLEVGLRLDPAHAGLRLMELELRYREGQIDLDEALFQLGARTWPTLEAERERERLVALISSS